MLWMERKASLSCRTVIPSQGSGGYRNSKPCSPGLYHHQSLDALSAPFSAFTAPNKGLYKHRARLDFETVAQLSWSTPNTSTNSSTALNTGFLWGILQQPEEHCSQLAAPSTPPMRSVRIYWFTQASQRNCMDYQMRIWSKNASTLPILSMKEMQTSSLLSSSHFRACVE